MPNRIENSSAALANCLTDAEFSGLPNFQRGKVRDSYDLPDGRRVMVATDRQSAFDIVLAAVPYKGQVLNETARFWFEETRDICPNHVIDYPDPNVAVARRLDMLPVEMVVRDYLTGSTETSIWPMYERGGRHMYGHTLPDGLVKNQKLPGTILTPTTKADVGGHDAPITATEIVKRGLLSQKVWDKLAEKSLALLRVGAKSQPRTASYWSTRSTNSVWTKVVRSLLPTKSTRRTPVAIGWRTATKRRCVPVRIRRAWIRNFSACGSANAAILTKRTSQKFLWIR